jgi:hypothetical protein
MTLQFYAWQRHYLERKEKTGGSNLREPLLIVTNLLDTAVFPLVSFNQVLQFDLRRLFVGYLSLLDNYILFPILCQYPETMILLKLDKPPIIQHNLPKFKQKIDRNLKHITFLPIFYNR